jgi:hypothetical protein
MAPRSLAFECRGKPRLPSLAHHVQLSHKLSLAHLVTAKRHVPSCALRLCEYEYP